MAVAVGSLAGVSPEGFLTQADTGLPTDISAGE